MTVINRIIKSNFNHDKLKEKVKFVLQFLIEQFIFDTFVFWSKAHTFFVKLYNTLTRLKALINNKSKSQPKLNSISR